MPKPIRWFTIFLATLAFAACPRQAASPSVTLAQVVAMLQSKPEAKLIRVVEEAPLPGYETSVERRTFYFEYGGRSGQAYRFANAADASKAAKPPQKQIDEFVVDSDLQPVIDTIRALKANANHLTNR